MMSSASTGTTGARSSALSCVGLIWWRLCAIRRRLGAGHHLRPKEEDLFEKEDIFDQWVDLIFENWVEDLFENWVEDIFDQQDLGEKEVDLLFENWVEVLFEKEVDLIFSRCA